MKSHIKDFLLAFALGGLGCVPLAIDNFTMRSKVESLEERVDLQNRVIQQLLRDEDQEADETDYAVIIKGA